MGKGKTKQISASPATFGLHPRAWAGNKPFPMGQQLRKVAKRRRRAAYLERKKAAAVAAKATKAKK